MKNSHVGRRKGIVKLFANFLVESVECNHESVESATKESVESAMAIVRTNA